MQPKRSLLLAWVLPATGFAVPILASEPTPFVDNYTTRADAFIAQTGHDGKGVVIFILDTGVDLDLPGLQVCRDGRPKILDARDMTQEGKVDLHPARFTAGRDGEVQVSSDETEASAAIDTTRVPLPADSLCFFGVLDEERLSQADIPDDPNGNGREDHFPLLVYPDSTGEEWGLLFDSDADGHLDDEAFTRSFHLDRRAIELTLRDTLETPVYVQLAPTVGKGEVSFHWAIGGHGSHVAGTAAGYRLYDRDDLHGNAPNAQIVSLKIGSGERGTHWTNDGSIVRAARFAADWSKEHPESGCVISMSYGGTPIYESEDQGVKDLEEILRDHPRLIMVTSAGNEGPGLDSMGSPAHGRDIIAAGNLVTKRIARDLWQAEIDEDLPLHSSCRGGVSDKPTCLAPGFHVSTVPAYEKDEAWQGTSMACPQVSGVIACWLSALLAEGLEWFREDVFHAIRSGSRSIGYPWYTEGAGIIEAVEGWRVLRKLADPDRATVAFEIKTVSPFGDKQGQGATAYWRGGSYPRASKRQTQTFRLTPTVLDSLSAKTKAAFYREYRLETDQPWIQPKADRFYIRGENEKTLEVTYDDARLEKEPGCYGGTISGISPDGVKEFQLRVTVVIPRVLDRLYRLEEERISLRGGRLTRHFVRVPPGTARLAARAEPVTKDLECRMRPILFDPTGREISSFNGFTDHRTLRTIEVIAEGPDLMRPGIYEVDLYASMDYRQSVGNFVIQLTGVSLEEAELVYSESEETPVVKTALANGLADFDGSLSLSLAGYQKSAFDTITVSEDTEIPLKIPESVDRLTLQWVIADSLLDRTEDSWAYVIDEADKALSSTDRGDRYSESTVGVDPSKDYRLRIEFTPTREIKSYQALWRILYHYRAPIAATADPAPTYIPVGRPVRTAWQLAEPPRLIPDGHEYLVRVVGESDEQGFEIWQGVGD